jgi:hypothetical protein
MMMTRRSCVSIPRQLRKSFGKTTHITLKFFHASDFDLRSDLLQRLAKLRALRAVWCDYSNLRSLFVMIENVSLD